MPASPIDLTTLAQVKSWLAANGNAPTNTSDDANVQACITCISAVLIWKTGFGPLDGSTITDSPFVAPVTYNETYDGNGSYRMFLRNRPIRSVASLQVSGRVITASSGWQSAGFVIDGTFASISMRNGNGGSLGSFSSYPLNGWAFVTGIQNVAITYSAGWDTTPPDVNLEVTKAAALNYKRKDWTGLKQAALSPTGGSTVYTQLEFEHSMFSILSNYKRYAVV